MRSQRFSNHNRNGGPEMQEFLVKQSNLDFRTREAYKMLRTNIEFTGDNNKVIFITSSMSGEGKSTVAFELAMSFAQNGMNTLLIDADTRKSVMKNRGKKANRIVRAFLL